MQTFYIVVVPPQGEIIIPRSHTCSTIDMARELKARHQTKATIYKITHLEENILTWEAID